jgi:hypothetical protein
MRQRLNERKIQIAVGAGILLALTLVVCGLLIGRPHMSGVIGEWIAFMVGVMTSPFFMEATFAVIGLTLVLAINHWRQKRAGDELMYLEEVDDPEGLPEHARWAVYREPLDGEAPSLFVQAEGALAIGDHETARECLAGMSEAELKRTEVLALRLDLAKATGKADLAASLEKELRGRRQDPVVP